MSARDKLIDWFEHSEDISRLSAFPMQLAEALLDEYVRELAEEIRADMERQGAGGQYDMGMKRACFLIDPEASSE